MIQHGLADTHTTNRALASIWDIAAGGSLGALTGILVGLSSSPVVGTLVGSISALLALFFGLGPLAGTTFDTSAKVRLVGFGSAATCAVMVGIAVRSNSLLSPLPIDELRKAGFTREEARLIIRARLDPDRVVVALPRSEARPSSSDHTISSAGLLTSSSLMSDDADACTEANPQSLNRSADILVIWNNLSGPWKTFGALSAGLPEATRTRLLKSVWNLKCGS